MRTIRMTVMLCVVVAFASLVLAGVVVAQLTTDYPIQIDTVATNDPCLKRDVVKVLLANSTKPTLEDFMENIVPASLRNSGALPLPSPAGTITENVKIPCAKSCYIFNEGNLPLWLRVNASNTQSNWSREDRHERFKGCDTNKWCSDSYFITKFTAICRVTKFHTKSKFKCMVPATGTHKQFYWVDP